MFSLVGAVDEYVNNCSVITMLRLGGDAGEYMNNCVVIPMLIHVCIFMNCLGTFG